MELTKKQQLDAAFRERVLWARSMTPEERMLAGLWLFEIECESMKAEIRAQFPEAGEDAVAALLRAVMNLRRCAEGKV